MDISSVFRGKNTRVFRLAAIFLLLAVAAVSLAWIGSRSGSLRDTTGYLALGLALGGVILICWLALKTEQFPDWIVRLFLGGLLLRLAFGAAWFITLPYYGYGSDIERAGYIFEDAYKRDTAAWELASSGKPLSRSFTTYRSSDQYGGLLFISAAVYRNFNLPPAGSGQHQPLMMVMAAAAISALAIPFTWGLSRRLWGEKVGWLAAWGMAIYPEAVLLGSAQMREAFTIPLAAMAIYGLVRAFQERKTAGIAIMLAALATSVVITPPFAALLAAVLTGLALVMDGKSLVRKRVFWLGVLAAVILIGVGFWLGWSRIAPEGVDNPVDLFAWWLRKAADYQAYLSKQGSGWIQRIFKDTPRAMHAPLLIAYGVVQPFLPAALFAGGAALWQAVAIWRAVGWTILLVMMVISLWLWVRHKPRPAVTGMAQLLMWAVILVASFRSGGDQWDNPRYRATLATLQIGLAAWAWVEGGRLNDAGVKRMAAGGLLALAWFVPWYLRRYIGLDWPVVDPFKTLGLGIATAVLYFVWEWARNSPQEKGG